MSLAERIQQLNHEIGATLEKAFSELRHEITERFRASGDEVAKKLEEFTPRLPSSFIDHEDLAPAAEELRSAATQARGAALGEIRDALAAIDRARSQAQILTALLEQSGRFASRAALLLLRAGEIHGWGGHGFADAALRDLVLAPPPDSFWARLASAAPGASNQTGQGPGASNQTAGSAAPGGSTQQIATTQLSSGECASLCSLIDSPVPREGVVVPLVLRDRVVAALYADRLNGAGEAGSAGPASATAATTAIAAEDGVLIVEALQVLTYAAAQAIESLPFRERSATSTLSIADQRDAGGASPLPTAAPQPAAVSPSPGEPSAEPLHPASAEAAGSPGAATIAAPVIGHVPAVPPVPKGSEPEPPPEIPEIEAEAETPQEAGADRGDETLDPWQPRREWRHEERAPEWPTARHLESEQTAEMPLPALAEEGERPDETARPTLQAVPILGPTPVSPASPAAGDAAAAPAGSTGSTGSVGAAASDPTAGGRNETVLVPRTPFREVDAPTAGAPPSSPAPWSAADTAKTPVTRPSAVPGPPEQGGSPAFEPLRPTPVVPATPEVRPPSGVQGPGWAFATTRVAVGSSEDALHEEARRLARLLVSEIKLYNEEQVEAGRRNRDLYERLREDIDRSRQMYEERVEPRLAKSTDYFYQELVRILAAGDSKALGI